MSSWCQLVYGYVTVPKVLTIENARLGLLHRFLQVGIFAWVFYNTFLNNAWMVRYKPLRYGHELWVTQGPEALVRDGSVRHCADADSFDYTYSAAWTYDVRACVRVPEGESYVTRDSMAFFPTTVRDRITRKASGTADCSALNATCVAEGGSFDATACECRSDEMNLVKNAEEIVVNFNHGYEVVNNDGTTWVGGDKGYQKEISASGTVKEYGPENGAQRQLLTVILGADGKECKVGGGGDGGAKSVWEPKDVINGIGGSLREWLACAGTSLDDERIELGSGLDSQVGQPTMRLAGASLTLELTYYNSLHSLHSRHYGVECIIRVKVKPMWNSEVQMAYGSLPAPGTGAGSHRYRKQYGVSVRFETRGEFWEIDYLAIVNMLVNAIVMFAIPGRIVCFVALYLLGPLSSVYMRSQAQVLNVGQEIFGIAARAVTGVQSFLDITGQRGGQVDEAMSKEVLAARLEDALSVHIASGTLDRKEFAKLVKVMEYGLSKDGEAGISLHDFMEAFTSNEAMQMSEIVAFFDTDRRRGFAERSFSNVETMEAGRNAKGAKVRPV